MEFKSVNSNFLFYIFSAVFAFILGFKIDDVYMKINLPKI